MRTFASVSYRWPAEQQKACCHLPAQKKNHAHKKHTKKKNTKKKRKQKSNNCHLWTAASLTKRKNWTTVSSSLQVSECEPLLWELEDQLVEKCYFSLRFNFLTVRERIHVRSFGHIQNSVFFFHYFQLRLQSSQTAYCHKDETKKEDCKA